MAASNSPVTKGVSEKSVIWSVLGLCSVIYENRCSSNRRHITCDKNHLKLALVYGDPLWAKLNFNFPIPTFAHFLSNDRMLVNLPTNRSSSYGKGTVAQRSSRSGVSSNIFMIPTTTRLLIDDDDGGRNGVPCSSFAHRHTELVFRHPGRLP